MTVLSSWVVIGIYLDGWAHTHGRVDQTFFTPYHALLYAGLFAVLVALAITLSLNRGRGYAWQQVLPAGYGLSLAGAVLFGLGGVADLIWHTLFGFEVAVEALVSPTHLVLALSAWLVVSGPWRAAWRRTAPAHSWWHQLPILLSLTMMLSLLTFFTQVAHPIPNPYFWGGSRPANDAELFQEIGVVSILLEAGILTGMILVAIRRWRLRFGAFTLLLTLNWLAMSLLYDGSAPLTVVAGIAAATTAIAGLVIDLLFRWLRPSVERPGALRLFAAAVPAVTFAVYFGGVQLAEGLWWSTHLWAGSIAMAGIVGLLLSYLLAPPASPTLMEHD